MSFGQTKTRILDALTKTLALDVRFYGRSFSWLALAYGSGVIRGVATTFLMARWLNPGTLGEFRYVLAIFGIAGIFSLTGMNSSMIRGIAKGDTIVVRVAMKRLLQFTPLGALVCLVAAAERFIHGEPAVAAALAVSGIAFVPYCLSGIYGQILTGQQKIRELSWLAVFNNIAFSIAFVAVLLNLHDLLSVTLAYFGFDVCFRGFLTWRELRRLPMKGSAEGHLSLGHHLSAIGVMQTLASQANDILIQRFWGYSSLASFSVATVIPDQIKQVVSSLGGTFLQRLSRHEKTEANLKTTRKHFWIGLLVSGGIVIAYAATAPFILPWLFPKYPGAALPSIVYALGILSFPSIVGVNFLQAHSEIRLLWKFYTWNTALQFATSIGLVPFFGQWGAVWAQTITRLGSLPPSYPRYGTSGESRGMKSETETASAALPRE